MPRFIAVPLNYEAANMGYPMIAKVVDIIPNYQLTEVTRETFLGGKEPAG